MSNVPTNEELAGMEIFPGGSTFGQAAQIMNTPFSTTGTTTPTDGRRPGESEAAYLDRLNREQNQRQFEQSQEMANEQSRQSRQNAFEIINSFLSMAKLTGLEQEIRGLLAGGIVDTDAVLFRLRDTQQFKDRFKANAARAAKGLPELDPATYIGLEQQYGALLRANRLPPGFYDDPSDFEKLLEGDVSPQELQVRIQDGFTRVRDTDPQIRAEMQRLYGVGTDEQLAAYFLDPQKGAQALQREAQAAQIAARGKEQAGMTLTAAQAEDLVRRGYTPEDAQRAFAQRGALEGLFNPLAGEQAMTQEKQIGATFGFDVQAQQDLERRRQQRLAEFQAGGQFARTSGATSGTVETGLGQAQ